MTILDRPAEHIIETTQMDPKEARAIISLADQRERVRSSWVRSAPLEGEACAVWYWSGFTHVSIDFGAIDAMHHILAWSGGRVDDDDDDGHVFTCYVRQLEEWNDQGSTTQSMVLDLIEESITYIMKYGIPLFPVLYSW